MVPSLDSSQLERAVTNRDVDAVRHLILAGEDINQGTEANGENILVDCLLRNDNAVAEALLKSAASHEVTAEMARQEGEDERTPLHRLAARGFEQGCNILCEHGADVSAVDSSLSTPLHDAVKGGFAGVVYCLLQYGAMVDTVDNMGRSPLWYAAGLADSKIVSLLLNAGATVDLSDNKNVTPLHRAAAVGNDTIAHTLLSRQADPNLKAKDGQTALHAGAEGGKADVVQRLLAHGALSFTDSFGNLPWDTAMRRGHRGVCLVLDPVATYSCDKEHYQKSLMPGTKGVPLPSASSTTLPSATLPSATLPTESKAGTKADHEPNPRTPRPEWPQNRVAAPMACPPSPVLKPLASAIPPATGDNPNPMSPPLQRHWSCTRSSSSSEWTKSGSLSPTPNSPKLRQLLTPPIGCETSNAPSPPYSPLARSGLPSDRAKPGSSLLKRPLGGGENSPPNRHPLARSPDLTKMPSLFGASPGSTPPLWFQTTSPKYQRSPCRSPCLVVPRVSPSPSNGGPEEADLGGGEVALLPPSPQDMPLLGRPLLPDSEPVSLKCAIVASTSRHLGCPRDLNSTSSPPDQTAPGSFSYSRLGLLLPSNQAVSCSRTALPHEALACSEDSSPTTAGQESDGPPATPLPERCSLNYTPPRTATKFGRAKNRPPVLNSHVQALAALCSRPSSISPTASMEGALSTMLGAPAPDGLPPLTSESNVALPSPSFLLRSPTQSTDGLVSSEIETGSLQPDYIGRRDNGSTGCTSNDSPSLLDHLSHGSLALLPQSTDSPTRTKQVSWATELSASCSTAMAR